MPTETTEADLRSVTCDRYPHLPVVDRTLNARDPDGHLYTHAHPFDRVWNCAGRLTASITPEADA